MGTKNQSTWNQLRKKIKNRNAVSWTPILITAGYLILGGLWIQLSDRILILAVTDPQALTRLQTIKGFLYVGTTGLLLWLSINFHTRKLIRKEHQLRNSKEQYLSLFKSIRDPILVANTRREIIDFNPAFSELFGYTLEDLQGQKTQVIYHQSEQYQSLGKKLAPQVSNPDISTITVYRKKNGETFPGETTVSYLRNNQGEVTGFIGIIKDISENLERESALLDSEESYRKLVEQAPVGIFRTTSDGKVLEVNTRMAEILGYQTKEEAINAYNDLGTELYHHPERRKTFLQELRKNQQVKDFVYQAEKKNGDLTWLSMNARINHTADDGSFTIQGFATDITERKGIEEALLSERNRAQNYLDIAKVMIVALNQKGTIILINDFGCQLLGYREEELLGKDWFEVCFPPANRQKMREVFQEMIEGRSPAVEGIQNPVITKDGTEKIIDWNNVLLKDESGQVTGILSSGNDITERLRAEQELKSYQEELEDLVDQRTEELEIRISEVETLNKALTNLLEDLQVTNRKLEDTTAQLQLANQELESFTYSVSHDLRAPLRAINGFSRILMSEFKPQIPDGAFRYLDLIQENANQMDILIKDLLSLSRLGQQALTIEQINTRDLVESVIDSLRRDYPDRKMEITLGTLPPCRADAGFLRQIYVNLIDNALKYTKNQPQAEIEISSFQEGTERVYFVKDNGVGFDMAYTDKLFGIFQRLHKSQDYEGTGVGLAIVQRLIHRHEGRIWAEGQVDQGATFYFTLNPSPEPG